MSKPLCFSHLKVDWSYLLITSGAWQQQLKNLGEGQRDAWRGGRLQVSKGKKELFLKRWLTNCVTSSTCLIKKRKKVKVLSSYFQHVSWDYLKDVANKATVAVLLLLTTHPNLASPAYPRPYFTAVAWQAVADHLLPDWQLAAALFPYAHFSCNNAYSSPHRDANLAVLLFFPLLEIISYFKKDDFMCLCEINASNVNIKVG